MENSEGFKMSDLSRIEKLIIDMHTGIKAEMSQLREEMQTGFAQTAKQTDLKAVAETLEAITLGEIAVAKEKATDEAETAYILSKSLIHGIDTQLSQQLTLIQKALLDGFKHIERIFAQHTDIMRSWVHEHTSIMEEFEKIKQDVEKLKKSGLQ